MLRRLLVRTAANVQHLGHTSTTQKLVRGLAASRATIAARKLATASKPQPQSELPSLSRHTPELKGSPVASQPVHESKENPGKAKYTSHWKKDFLFTGLYTGVFVGCIWALQAKEDEHTHSKHKKAFHPGNEVVRLYVWQMHPDTGVGHAALQIGGDKPKMTLMDPGLYSSIWPSTVPSMGPLTIFPLPASLASTLTQDARSEGQAARAVQDEFSRVSADEVVPSIPPDLIYEIRGLDTDAMRHEMSLIQRGVKEGTVCYQLFPVFNVVSRFMNMISPIYAAILTQDPFTGEPIPHLEESLKKEKHHPIRVYNCTSLAEHFLNKGGLKVHSHSLFHRPPWDISPNALAAAVEKDPRAKKVL